MATMNGEAEEEFNHTLSFKGNMAVSFCVACLAGLAMCSEVGPVLAACSAGLAGAASFGWGVYFGGVPPECDDY